MTDYGDDEGVVIEEASDSNFPKEHEEHVACVVQRLLCNQKAIDIMQQHQFFYSMCSVKNNMFNLNIDNESCENIISSALVDYLKL